MIQCLVCNNLNRDTVPFCPSCGQLLLLAGRYRIIQTIKKGGMGAVYLAQDLKFSERKVAVKENSDNSPTAQTQFRKEADVLAKLKHVNLPEVSDYFVAPSGRQYLVMEYVEGEDLDDWLGRHGKFSEEQVLDWATRVMDALEYLHTRVPSVIHRDVKPANIKITPDGNVRLVDFGLVKVMGQGSASVWAGTPGFAPPEQYGGGSGTDARSDVYTLGATLYALVTGQIPEAAILRKVGTHLPAPRKYNRTVSARTQRVILRMTELEPVRRFQTISSVRKALDTDRKTRPAIWVVGIFLLLLVLSSPIWGAQMISPLRSTPLPGSVMTAVFTTTLTPTGIMTVRPSMTTRPTDWPTATFEPSNTPIVGTGLTTATDMPVPTSTPLPTTTAMILPTKAATQLPTHTATRNPTRQSTPLPTSTLTPLPAPTDTPLPDPHPTEPPPPTNTSAPLPTEPPPTNPPPTNPPPTEPPPTNPPPTNPLPTNPPPPNPA